MIPLTVFDLNCIFIMVEVRLFEEDFNFSVLLSVVPVGALYKSSANSVNV